MCHSLSQPDQNFFNTLDKTFDIFSNYENLLLLGDFNIQIVETHLDAFLYQHELANINEQPC